MLSQVLSSSYFSNKYDDVCYTKILEVNLLAFAYRLFRRDLSPLDGTYCMGTHYILMMYVISLYALTYPVLVIIQSFYNIQNIKFKSQKFSRTPLVLSVLTSYCCCWETLYIDIRALNPSLNWMAGGTICHHYGSTSSRGKCMQTSQAGMDLLLTVTQFIVLSYNLL